MTSRCGQGKDTHNYHVELRCERCHRHERQDISRPCIAGDNCRRVRCKGCEAGILMYFFCPSQTSDVDTRDIDGKILECSVRNIDVG